MDFDFSVIPFPPMSEEAKSRIADVLDAVTANEDAA